VFVLDGKKPVNALAFTPDGKRLLAMRYPTPLEVWSLSDGEPLPSPAAKADGNLTVHPSGRVAYVTEPKFTAIPLTGRSKVTYPGLGSVQSVIFSRDGRFAIVEPASAKGRLRGFRCDANGTLAKKPTWAVKPHEDVEMLGGFVGTGDQFVVANHHLIVIRDTATGEVTSPDGSRFAAEGYNKLYLWNTTTWGKPVRLNSGTGSEFTPLAFHPTRPILMAILGGRTLVKFLDADTGKVLRKFQWKIGDLRCVAFSPDGTLAAASSVGGKIVVWDVDE
jgi:WD40 repeat protein